MVRLKHSLKACPPIKVTLSGMTMDVREEQPKKALRGIVVVPAGILIWVMEESLPA